MSVRIGHGYDVHKLVPDRELIIGGIKIPHDKGLLGHSDADVLIHAICDALLGAAALRDIGYHFPDKDPATEGIDSAVILKKVDLMLKENGYRIGNIDATVIAQKPKLSRFIPSMIKKIAEILDIPVSDVNIKATTEEKLGFTGRCEGIAAHAVCVIQK